jgi:hypothetical protein
MLAGPGSPASASHKKPMIFTGPISYRVERILGPWRHQSPGAAQIAVDLPIAAGGSNLYTESRTRDAFLFLKATLSNQLARFAPGLYMRLTRQTGRGKEEQPPHEVARYFLSCFQDYHEQLQLTASEFSTFICGKQVLEYGPGDILGVALLLYAHGAESVHCVDRFSLHKRSERNVRVYESLLESLSGQTRERACSAFVEYGKPTSPFKSSAITYCISADGLAGATRQYDRYRERTQDDGNLDSPSGLAQSRSRPQSDFGLSHMA